MTAARGVVLAAALLVAFAPASRAQAKPAHGWLVRVERSDLKKPTRGELIAVSSDTVWVLTDSQLVRVPAQSVVRVRVKRRPIGAGGIMKWALTVGFLSGVGLAVACGSVEDTSGCGVLIPAFLVNGALFGGLWAGVAGSEYSNAEPFEFEQRLRQFARFPQGLPQTFDPGRRD